MEKVRRVEFEMPELAAESVPFLSFSILIFHDFSLLVLTEKTKIESDLFICYSNPHSVCAFVVLSLVHVCCSANCQIYIHVVITSLSTELLSS